MHAALWQTVWQGPSIVVQRDGEEVDRIHAQALERVIVVYRRSGDTPSDLSYALLETSEDTFVLPADTGIAGRLHFERQPFWNQKGCIYWVRQGVAGLPGPLRRGLLGFGLGRPRFMRVPRAKLAPIVERWPLEGPQTWEERKWRRIERSRPFASSTTAD